MYDPRKLMQLIEGPGSGLKGIAIRASAVSAWRNKAGIPVRQYDVVITNNSPDPVCPGTRLALASPGLSLEGKPGVWNLELVEGAFRLPHWATIRPGEPSRPCRERDAGRPLDWQGIHQRG